MRLARRRPRQRRRRLLALLPFRDEMRFLPDLFRNLEGQVDGVVALDDGSRDGSRAFVEAQPLLAGFLANPSEGRAEIDDSRLHRTLIDAAAGLGADWFLGIDADERVERGFRGRAEAEIDAAEAAGHPALWVRFLELWGSRDRYRVDGIWGEKRKACLFAADPGAVFDERPLHAIWAPWPPVGGEYPTADLLLYHLRMILPEDREARAERYRRLDPERRHQTVGYDYLVDETGLELAPLAPGRGFVP